MRHVLAAIAVATILVGCASEPSKPAVDPKIEAAKKELKEYTQRLVSFNVHPKEQAVRVGEVVSFSVIVRNEGDQPIDGVHVYTSGPWSNILEKKISPAGEFESGFLTDVIASRETIQPHTSVTISISGRVSDSMDIETNGHEFGFAPTVSLDKKELVGDTDLQNVRVYILPKK